MSAQEPAQPAAAATAAAPSTPVTAPHTADQEPSSSSSSTSGGRKRKARRAPRKKRAANGGGGGDGGGDGWVPYNELPWQQRREQEEKDMRRARQQEREELALGVAAARAGGGGKGHRGKGKGGHAIKKVRVAAPPAPRITRSAAMDEREARAALPLLDDTEEAAATLVSAGDSTDGGLGDAGGPDTDFMEALEDCVDVDTTGAPGAEARRVQELHLLSKAELIRRLLAATAEVDRLQQERAAGATSGATADGSR